MLRMYVGLFLLLLFQILFRKYKMLDNSPLISILKCMQELSQVFTVGSSDSDCPWVKCRGWMVSLSPSFSGSKWECVSPLWRSIVVLHPLGELSSNLLDATTQEAKANALNLTGLAWQVLPSKGILLWISILSGVERQRHSSFRHCLYTLHLRINFLANFHM